MKILFNIKSLNIAGGMERMTTVIANELAKRDYEVGIVCLAFDGAPFFELLPVVKTHYLYSKKDMRPSLVRDFSRRIELRKLYQKEKPDIVVFVGSGRSMLNIPAAKGITSITWEHFNANVNWHLLHPVSKWMAAKFCDRVVTLTQQDVKNYERKFGAKNAVCIPNPLTIQHNEHSPLTEKRVLAVGRLMPQKGFDLLIEAWRKTENRKKGWKLRIVGAGRDMDKLQKQIAESGVADSAEIVPPTNDIVSQYKQASIFALSSRYEGFVLVLLEAMAMGLPSVSFDCETGPAEIIENNLTGILAPPMNVDKLAEALDNLMTDEKKRAFFSKNAVNRAKLFEIDKITDKWEKLLKELKNEQ